MSARFMVVRKIVLPLLSMVILASQLTGCAALSSNELLDELSKGNEVVLEYNKR